MASSLLIPALCKADVAVKPAGVKIVWKSLGDEFDGFKTYNSSEGAYITLALHGGDKGIIGFDKDGSNLSISDGSKDLGGKFGMWNKISKDGKWMRLEVASKEVPAAEASKLTVKGKLSVVVASKTETKSSKARAFKKGDSVELTDNFKFEIESVGKPKWGKDALAVELKWKRKVPELSAVRFYDSEGNEIESSKGGSSSSGMFGKYTVRKTYNLKKKSDTLRIEMDLWVDSAKSTVPVDLTIGVGGGK